MRLADAPPPGWYPDPDGTSRLRWWEGTDWTDVYRARPTQTELEARAFATGGDRTATGQRPAQVRAQAAKALAEAPEVRGALRRETEEIIAEVRKVARSEVERAADLFSARAKAATKELQPLISQYTNRLLRWVKWGVVVAIVLVIAWIVFQAIAQQTFLDWIGDRIDNLSD